VRCRPAWLTGDSPSAVAARETVELADKCGHDPVVAQHDANV
jgi:hypothetical protein